ncbi:protein transport protein Sec16B [Brachyistius frenatus]|uniref:protein transport protein Sec16B n=1 Tax=Brachyistius frenatus TaxID=100188 RepID=UPI0037E8F8AC
MDYSGNRWPDSDRHSHRTKDREYSRYSQGEKDNTYPPADTREWERRWGHPDACYRADFINPPARHEQFPYNAQQHVYGRPELERPHSRHGHDYRPQSHWDHRASYGYYDYYRGQHGLQDAGELGPQSLWRADQHYERTNKQEHQGCLYTEEYRDDPGTDSSQHYPMDNPSRDNEEKSSYSLWTLESSKNSGLSSSSYELSQYMNEAEHSDPVPQPTHKFDGEHGPVHQMSAPLKYSIPHAVVSFGPAGQLIRVTPGLLMQENVSQLEIHSLEVILSETREQQEMRNFPGPLTREDLHKVDAIEFANQRAAACMKDEKLHDKSSAVLLWNLLILLYRQNGQIVGSDIAELLMQGSHSDGSWESDAPTLIDFNDDMTAEASPCQGDDLLSGNLSSFTPETSEKALQSYTQLLLAGRKKEALESAMTSGLWGHAFFLASKMGNRSYMTVLNRFTSQIMACDPLQTLFQLLSGRTPAVATCCGNEKWGDWKPHLAVMLSNETGDPAIQHKAIVTMGDTLASRGLIYAAHVCYMTASVPFGVFTQKAERLVLLGSSHKQSFENFATNSAIHCTELYEYCQTLGGKCFSVPFFQVYKLLYASRLVDFGLSSQALHYCEVVGQTLLRQKEPFFVLTGEVIKLSQRLTYSDGQFTDAGTGQEPGWLKLLHARHHSMQTGSFDRTETYPPTPEISALAHEDSKVSSDYLNRDIQSHDPGLLYHRGTKDQENPVHQAEGNTEEMTAMSWDIRGAKDWPHTNSPSMPVMAVHASPVHAVDASQNFSYHNTDSTEVTSTSPHCPLSKHPSAAEGAKLSFRAGMMDTQMLEGDINQHGQSRQKNPSRFRGLQAVQ